MSCQTSGAENQLNIEISSPRGCRAERLKGQTVASKLCLETQSSHEICGVLLFRTFQFEQIYHFLYYCSLSITFATKYLPDEIYIYIQVFDKSVLFKIFIKIIQGKLLSIPRGIYCTDSHGYFIKKKKKLCGLFSTPVSPVKIVSNKAV